MLWICAPVSGAKSPSKNPAKGDGAVAKNILVLTGSPRKAGNSDLLADAFIRGAAKSGHKLDKFETAFHHIGGCLGCNGCWSKGTPCVQKDDFNGKLAPGLEAADMLVFSMPLYAYTFPAQIKAVLDRLFPYGKEEWMRQLKVAETALILCGADDEDAPFQPAVGSYRLLINYFGWTDRGALIVPGVSDPGDVRCTDGLQRAEAFGEGMQSQ